VAGLELLVTEDGSSSSFLRYLLKRFLDTLAYTQHTHTQTQLTKIIVIKILIN